MRRHVGETEPTNLQTLRVLDLEDCDRREKSDKVKIIFPGNSVNGGGKARYDSQHTILTAMLSVLA